MSFGAGFGATSVAARWGSREQGPPRVASAVAQRRRSRSHACRGRDSYGTADRCRGKAPVPGASSYMKIKAAGQPAATRVSSPRPRASMHWPGFGLESGIESGACGLGAVVGSEFLGGNADLLMAIVAVLDIVGRGLQHESGSQVCVRAGVRGFGCIALLLSGGARWGAAPDRGRVELVVDLTLDLQTPSGIREKSHSALRLRRRCVTSCPGAKSSPSVGTNSAGGDDGVALSPPCPPGSTSSQK